MSVLFDEIGNLLMSAIWRCPARLPGFCLAVAGCLWVPGPAQAQQRQEDIGANVFRDMLDDITDPNRSLRLALTSNDPATVVAGLERTLRLDPSLQAIRLRLAEIYLLLGARALAEFHLRAALASGQLDEEQKSKAEELLANASAKPWGFSGSVFAGMRVTSNANLAPVTPTVEFAGMPITLTPNSVRRGDYSGLLVGNSQYLTADGYETNAKGYIELHNQQTTVNSSSVELNTGPRLTMGTLAGGQFSARLYGTALYQTIDSHAYDAAVGGGVTLRDDLAGNVRIEWQTEETRQNYRSTGYYPTGAGQRGNDINTSLQGIWAFGPGRELSGEVEYGDETAHASYFTRQHYAVQLGYSNELNLPILEISAIASGTARFYQYYYATPDVFVDPNITRNDRRFDLGISLTSHVIDSILWTVAGDETINLSNLPNYEYRALSATIGLTFTF